MKITNDNELDQMTFDTAQTDDSYILILLLIMLVQHGKTFYWPEVIINTEIPIKDSVIWFSV